MNFKALQFTYRFLFRTYRFEDKKSVYYWKDVWEEYIHECHEYFVGKSLLYDGELVEIYDFESFDGIIHLNVRRSNGIAFRIKLEIIKEEDLYD